MKPNEASSNTNTNPSNLNDADTARFRKLFDSIDLNKDGHLEIGELAVALKNFVPGSTTATVQVDAQVYIV